MYIPIRDETLYMIELYQYFFKKYWNNGMQVYFLGYKKPEFELVENVNFISLAEKRDPRESAWSNNLIDFFNSIDDEFFYFSLEDLLVIRPVDFELLNICEEMLDANIGRIDLWNSIQFDPNRKGWISLYKENKGVKFVKIDQNAPAKTFRISCSNSIWNKKWFLKTLERNWSSLQWEDYANDGRNKNDGFDVISPIDRWTPSTVHAVCRLWSGKINIDGVLPEDLENIKKIYGPNADNVFFKFDLFNQVHNLTGYQPSNTDISNI